MIKDVDILMTIMWVQRAWKDVFPWMVKRCVEKCGFRKIDADLIEEDDEEDPEFLAFVYELFPDLSIDDYLKFNESVPTASPLLILEN